MRPGSAGTEPTKAETARQFGANAEAYASSPIHAHGSDLATLLGFLDLTPQSTVLDIATGAGHTAAAIAPHVKQVIAIDLAPEMIEQAEALAASRGLTNVTVTAMDVENMTFEDASFDVVTCRLAAHHFTDLPLALQQITPVLRPGGQLGLVDNVAPADPDLDAFLNHVEKLRDPTHVRLPTVGQWHRLIEDAGLVLEHDELERKTHPVKEWIDRSGVDASVRRQVYKELLEAPSDAQKFFEITRDVKQVQSFSADAMILVARKPG